jgi:hypothetical protein
MRGRERRRRGRLRSLCEEAGADTRDLESIGETEHWSCRFEVTGHDKPGQKTVSLRVDHSAASWRCRATVYAVNLHRLRGCRNVLMETPKMCTYTS